MELYWNDRGEKTVKHLTDSDTIKRNTETSEKDIDFDLLADEAWKLHLKNHNDEALDLISLVLKLNPHEDYYNIKAVIYDDLSMFEKADECYSEALKLNPHNKVIRQNKVEMLYLWAEDLFIRKRRNKASLSVIDNAIDNLDANSDDSKFLDLKSKILEKMGRHVEARRYYHKSRHNWDKLEKFNQKVTYLENTEDTLINITGVFFYKGIEIFKKGTVVDLIAEPENEHDRDAIKVEIDGETVGYVANSPSTLIECVNSASELKGKIENNQKAEIQFVFLDSYIIAKLIGQNQNDLIKEIESNNRNVEKFLSEMDEVIKSVKDY